MNSAQKNEVKQTNKQKNINMLNKESRLTLVLTALVILRFYYTSSLDFIIIFSFLGSAEDEIYKTERDLSHGVQLSVIAEN